jgi:chromate transporter
MSTTNAQPVTPEQPTAARSVSLGEIARVFLKIGAMSYGGPAIMGIMQAEIQEKRQWIDKKTFVDGLALVNMLPGPGATQLGIFIGHAKAGIAGGIIAGLGFILPAFAIMLALSAAYLAYGTLPSMRSAFYGIGPVVIGIFAVAIYRLGKNAIKDHAQIAIALGAAAAMLCPQVGLIAILLIAGCSGIALFGSRKHAAIAFAFVLGMLVLVRWFEWTQGTPELTSAGHISVPSGVEPSLWDLGTFFFKVGAFTFGGGLSMLAFIQEQVVTQLGWLTPQEFVDGLALGQLTPGPVLMLGAFIGFKLKGVVGAAIAAGAIFLPSFLMMLTILPLLKRMGNLAWLRAFMRAVGPAVIGALAVSLAQMTPHAAPDWITWLVLAGTVAVMLWRNTGPLPALVAGGALGVILKENVIGRVRDLVR